MKKEFLFYEGLQFLSPISMKLEYLNKSLQVILKRKKWKARPLPGLRLVGTG
jgi:hypothetical protein